MSGTSRRQGWARVALALALAGGLVACGDDDDSSSTATTPATEDTTTGDVEGGGEVAAAQAVVDEFLQSPERPTAAELEPLTSPPEEGLTFVWLQCDSPGCQVIADALVEATDAIGWNLEVINFSLADPTSLTAAMQQALTLDPVAVSFSGLPAALWQQELPAYEEAGIALIPIAVGPVDIAPPIIAHLNGPSDNQEWGRLLANWAIADSNAEGKILLATVPDIGSFADFVDSFNQNVADGCAACEVEQLDITIAQLGAGEAAPAIASAAQRDPSITHVVVANGEFMAQGLPAALEAAGIEGIRVAGNAPNVANLQGLTDDSTHAWTILPSRVLGWMLIDTALRVSQDMDVLPDGGGHAQGLLTADNIGTPSDDSSNLPSDMDQQFLELWGVV